MNALLPRLNASRLREVREARGLSARALSLAAGLDQGYVSRIERRELKDLGEVGFSHIAQIAGALRVTIEGLLHDAGPGWIVGSWLKPDPIAQFLDEMRRARSCITCTQGVESYLLPDDMAIFLGSRAHQQLGYDQHRLETWLNWADSYRRAQQTLRREASFIHRVIAPDRDFHDPFVRQQKWIEQTGEIVEGFEDCVALGLIPVVQFRDLTWEIAKIIGFPSWDKITVVDDLVAMVRPNRDVYLLSYSEETVRLLRHAIERVGSVYVQYDFPIGDQFRPADCRKSSQHAVRRLRRIAANGR